MFFLEVIIGQYTSEGGITCWEKICPLFSGEYGAEVTRAWCSSIQPVFVEYLLFARYIGAGCESLGTVPDCR